MENEYKRVTLWQVFWYTLKKLDLRGKVPIKKHETQDGFA
jgi:hypothetical protein